MCSLLLKDIYKLLSAGCCKAYFLSYVNNLIYTLLYLWLKKVIAGDFKATFVLMLGFYCGVVHTCAAF